MITQEQRRLQIIEGERKKEEARRERHERARKEDAELREAMLKRHFEVAEVRQAEEDLNLRRAMALGAELKRLKGEG